ncbi:helix-turn-helix domain-containing protein [Gordonia insulae]|nr:helix-turn-helix domain-containing protein [Gordonia insulae]
MTVSSESRPAPYRERRVADVAGTVWTGRHDAGSSTILPDGCMDLIWTGRRILVAGPDTRPYVHHADVAGEMVGLRLDPGVAPTVLGCAADELRDTRTDLADLWTRAEAQRWCSAIVDADDPASVLVALTRTRVADRPAWLGPVVANLAAGRRIDLCADVAGVTARTLHRQSLHHFGYGPKTLQRILRMRAAMTDLGVGRDLSAVAYRRGFADYPHMHREFVELAGHGPATFAVRAGHSGPEADQPRAQ